EVPVFTVKVARTREELQFSEPGVPGGRVLVGRVIIGMAKATLEARRKRILVAAAGGTSLVTLLSVALAGALARGATRPLQALAAAARAIADGRLETTVSVRSRDEIGALARSFNEMSRSLAQSQSELREYSRNLEDKVRARTTLLEEANRELREANR